MAGTFFGHLLEQLEFTPHEGLAELGILLMTLGEGTCRVIDQYVRKLMEMSRGDGRRHNFTVNIGSAGEGITFHCKPRLRGDEREAMAAYCYARKYVQKAARWYGLSADTVGRLQFGLVIEFPWEHSAEMDGRTASMMRRSNVPITPDMPLAQAVRSTPKVGRNDPCPCGSGKKHKKRCLYN